MERVLSISEVQSLSHIGRKKYDNILIGFKDLALLTGPFGGKLTPLPKFGRRPVRAHVTQVTNLFLYTLHALMLDKQTPGKKRILLFHKYSRLYYIVIKSYE